MTEANTHVMPSTPTRRITVGRVVVLIIVGMAVLYLSNLDVLNALFSDRSPRDKSFGFLAGTPVCVNGTIIVGVVNLGQTPLDSPQDFSAAHLDEKDIRGQLPSRSIPPGSGELLLSLKCQDELTGQLTEPCLGRHVIALGTKGAYSGREAKCQ